MLEDNEAECGYIEHDGRYANHKQYYLFVLLSLSLYKMIRVNKLVQSMKLIIYYVQSASACRLEVITCPSSAF